MTRGGGKISSDDSSSAQVESAVKLGTHFPGICVFSPDRRTDPRRRELQSLRAKTTNKFLQRRTRGEGRAAAGAQLRRGRRRTHANEVCLDAH